MSVFTESYSKEQIKNVQRALNEICYVDGKNFVPLKPDGVFGALSVAMLKKAQEYKGYPVTGVYDGPIQEYCADLIDRKYISDAQLRELAAKYEIEYAMLKAFTLVESKESGFLPSGRCVILFERHKFYQALKAKLSKDELNYYATTYPDIVNISSGGYLGLEREWDRLNRAKTIDPRAALESASWGLGQVMGFNAKLIGYSAVFQMVDEFTISEKNQVEGMLKFCRATPVLFKALKDKDFPKIARYYNGPNYAINKYDVKLSEAYSRFEG